MHAEAFQHGEGEGSERDERKQRRVDEPHRPQVEFACQQVADQREREAEDIEQPVRGLDRQVVAVEQELLGAFPELRKRDHRGSVAQARGRPQLRP